ncbi:sodium:calcium exchanger [Halomicronema hongdechloris C2206]|uniref:Sodium:calcium exchanger n=1 Tax=Halomicronema hongdechloris C2206 TaxID=1641165 RepID=A0A1Z3HIK7_9CYAN|nr:NAD-binding protein [Halomicronema hongdechloris]ASC70096.1 sodium:calcium exchanger [Halomicronema hongdechloris C2206]
MTFGNGITHPTPDATLPRQPQIIVCGLGRTGFRIFSLLRQQGADVIGVNPTPLPQGCYPSHDIVVGDLQAAATLQRAGIEVAHTLLLANSDDALNLAILTQARLLNPQIRIINRLFNASLGERLDQTLPRHVSMSVAALAGPLFAFAALGNRAIGQIRLFDTTWPMHEEIIREDHPWRGQPLRGLWESRQRMLIYYWSAQHRIDLVSAVMAGHRLQPGDRLIVATRPARSRPHQRSAAQAWRRLMNTLHQVRRRSRAALTVLLALMLTIAIATGTYVGTSLDTSLVDALYFAVGMITGAGGQEQVAETATAAIKVFTAVMMLVGAGVIGVCYALLNDFILGTRFHEFWNVARLPQQQHYVVCGLGGVGYRIATQLQTLGHEVVVIERDAQSRFLGAAKALNLPVIIGDASLASTLETVQLKRAAALVAVTSDDTVNLEIALTARSVAPRLAVVVRNQDPEFAQQVQQVFEFDQVMSPTELAAPAFAAAALGGRILGNGMAGHHLWVAIATLITPNHPFCQQTIKALAPTTDLVPLYIESQGHTIHGLDLLEFVLQSGDILYMTLPASRLEQLWRHTATPLITP